MRIVGYEKSYSFLDGKMKHTYFKSSKKEFKDSIVNQNENHETDIYLS